MSKNISVILVRCLPHALSSFFRAIIQASSRTTEFASHPSRDVTENRLTPNNQTQNLLTPNQVHTSNQCTSLPIRLPVYQKNCITVIKASRQAAKAGWPRCGNSSAKSESSNKTPSHRALKYTNCLSGKRCEQHKQFQTERLQSKRASNS